MMILSILFLDFMPKYPVMITKTLTCHLMMALVISAVVCCKIVAFSVFAVPHTARCVMMINIIITILSNSISVSRHYKIFCVNGNTGFRNESRIFYFIHLQNEEAYERKESSSA